MCIIHTFFLRKECNMQLLYRITQNAVLCILQGQHGGFEHQVLAPLCELHSPVCICSPIHVLVMNALC